MKTCPACESTYPDDYALCPRDGAKLITQSMETEAQLAAGLSRRFRIVRRLGQGGMGTVFLAEQIAVGNRPVALKVLNRKLLDDPDFLMRFQNEAGSTGRIHHTNVVTIFESGQGEDGTPYIAMEFLEGKSLRDVLSQRGALPVNEVSNILLQAAKGLNAAHKLGIIHRDLKPDNIFLTHDEEGGVLVKMVDFGIAKLRESSTQTMTGMVLGTPAYMSYEQAAGMRSDEIDARSDIYSIGVVVYEMLTGRVPFQSDTPVGYLRKHLQDCPPPFRTVSHDLAVSPSVESAVMKALAKDRNHRYESVLDFACDLTRNTQVLLPTEASKMLPSTRIVLGGTDRTPQRWRVSFAILASVIVLGSTVGYILLHQTRRTGTVPQTQLSQPQATKPPGSLPQETALNPALVTAQPTSSLQVGTSSSKQVEKAPDMVIVRVLTGHVGSVLSVAFSPDGHTLASASSDMTIKLWEVATGRELRTFVGHTDRVTSVAFSPDGRSIASGSKDMTIKLWEVATGQELRTLVGHSSTVESVAFSPDGRTIASAGNFDKTIKLWDVATGRELRTLEVHTISVNSVAFSPDGRTLASSGYKAVRLWDVATGQELRALEYTIDVNCAAFSPNGRILAGGGLFGIIKLWEVATGRLVRTLTGPAKSARCVAFSPDGRTLVAGSNVLDDNIKLWNVATGQELSTLAGHTNSLAFSPDGHYLATGGADRTVKLWHWQE